MPRTLPWKSKGDSTVVTKTKRTATASSTLQKKPRLQSATPGTEEQSTSSSRKERVTTSELPPSSSPPPEAPEETLLIEGFDQDDKFRMVEDELLTIAQTFTAHLHAAEYKRQQKMVKSRNAETIDSISRPAVGKMPDHTRRRVEGVARAKAQHGGLEGLLGIKKQDGDMSDSDDGVGLPYIGTTLHGLMDSPRKKAALISKVVPLAATTRAAAGFNKPATKNKSNKKAADDTHRPKVITREGSYRDGSVSETSDDDDLDAPIPAPKLVSIEKRTTSTVKTTSSVKLTAKLEPNIKARGQDVKIREPSVKIPVQDSKTREPGVKVREPTQPIKKSSSPLMPPPKKEPASYSFDDVPEFLSHAGSRPSRVRARQLKVEQETSQQKLDEIPSFL